MNDLIKIDETGKTTARELYEFLSPDDKSHYSRWAKTNIEENEFYQEGAEWQGFATMASGNEIKDYSLTIDFAKHLCMLSRSERGKQARNYFVEVEKRYKLQPVHLSRLEILELALKTEKENIELTKQLDEAKPKVDFFNAVADSKDAVPMNEVSKVLAIKGMGRNNLFEFLRNQKVLMNDNQPYQKFIDCGYFRTIEQKYTDKTGEAHISFKTLVYQKGLDHIRRLVNF